ncbi:MAG: peptide MFS transporter [Schleiferiaceae bacterium]|jgi:POT family proton-dependent oligopeptide transporter|nr:peptide MFS transporter [Schleiferiaceae bacterium]
MSKSHPKGLYVLFVTEMWERFSYYGMRGIFALFMIKALLFDKALASTIYGNYTGLVYLTPLIGGYVADRYWGNRKSIFWGGIMMAIGQFMLFGSALLYEQIAGAEGFSTGHLLFYGGLGFLIFGNGFFKPNISTMVGQLYPEGDNRLDSAMTIFYMGINLGAFIAPLVAGGFGDTGDPADFKWGFLAAALGMVLSTIIFELLKNKYIVTSEGAPVGMPPAKNDVKDEEEKKPVNFAEIIGYIVLGTGLGLGLWKFAELDGIASTMLSITIVAMLSIIRDKELTKIEKQRIGVIYICALFVIFFWSAFEQAGVSLTFFAEEQTNRNIMGWEMPASFFQSFNALFIVIFAPIMAWLWTKLGDKKMEPASPYKQAIGLFLLAIGYLVIAFGVKDVDPNVKVSMMWLVGLYWLHTIGELALSPIGLSMVVKLSPVKFTSLLMGVWFLAMANANKFAGVLSSFYPDPSKPTPSLLGFQIETLYDFFMIFVFMAGGASIILFFLSKTLLKMMHGIR